MIHATVPCLECLEFSQKTGGFQPCFHNTQLYQNPQSVSKECNSEFEEYIRLSKGTSGTSQKVPFSKADSGALKDELGKLRYDLIPPEMIKALAEVLTYGSIKYADRNWEKGLPFMTNVASALRHFYSFLEGIDKDSESGLNHIEQAAVNLLMISTQIRRGRKDLDNRPTKDEFIIKSDSK